MVVFYSAAVTAFSVSLGAVVEGMWGLGLGSLVFGAGMILPVVAGRVGVESKPEK